MDWPALERHFHKSTKQNRPAVDNAIEWDYSRYSRALGMTALPGLHQLPATSVALITGGWDAWDDVHQRYRQWGEARGYRAIRVSAYPSLLVPDPVVAGIADAVAGPDSMILARAGQQGEPALGKRPRSPGCSLAISPGERWLIAADRVRRRVRQEIAIRGLIVQIDDAEKLTANSLEMISYLVRAHTAWKDRMLSRDARIYFVLATTPRNEELVLKTLRRFQICDLIIDRRPLPDLAPSLSKISVEDEHVLAALCSVPVALPQQLLGDVVGRSSAKRVSRLCEHGFGKARRFGQSEAFPRPVARSQVDAGRCMRLADALYDVIRKCARGTHAWWAVAVLDSERHRWSRSMVSVRAMPIARACVVPCDVAVEHCLGQQADAFGVRMAVACILTALRLDEHARRLLVRPVCRGPLGLLRVVRMLLAIGRDALDRVLPDDFWLSLQATDVGATSFECLVVLLEFFHRMRWLREAEHIERYAVVRQLIRGADNPGNRPAMRLLELNNVLYVRMTLGLASPAGDSHAVDELKRLDVGRVLNGESSAYLMSTVSFAETQCSLPKTLLPFGGEAWCDARQFVSATGNVADSNVQTRWLQYHLAWCGMRFLARGATEEAILTSGPPTSSSHFMMCRALSGSLPSRASSFWELPLNQVPFNRAAARISSEAASRSWIRVAAGRGGKGPDRAPNHRACVRAFSVATRDWGQFLALQARESDSRLPDNLGAYRYFCEDYRQGLDHLLSANFGRAVTSFEHALRAFPGIGSAQVRVMRDMARRGHRAARVLDRWRDGSMLSGVELLVALAVDRAAPVLADGRGLATVARYWTLGVEAGARNGSLDLRTCVGPLLLLSQVHCHRTDFARSLSEVAPVFFDRIQSLLGCGSGEPTEQFDSALAGLRGLWSYQRLFEQLWHGSVMCLRAYELIVPIAPRVRASTRLSNSWHEDATLFHEVHSRCGKNVELPTVFFLPGWKDPITIRLRVRKSSQGRWREGWRVTTEGPAESENRRRYQSRHSTLLGSSQHMADVRALLDVAARNDHPVLIHGPSGAGKSLAAMEIHRRSRYSAFLVTDCSSLNRTLAESELFGHERGAFSGATRSHEGLLGVADGKTWILDGVETLTPRLQAMLLRTVETGEYRSVGAAKCKRAQFRLIAVVKGDPLHLIANGALREDLYYRMSTIDVRLPSLQERVEDIRALVKKVEADEGVVVLESAIRELERCAWPGNVRQLLNVVRRAHAQYGGTIDVSILRALDGQRLEQADSRAEAIIGAVGVEPRSAKDIAAELDISLRSAQRGIREALLQGRILRIGAGRSCQYKRVITP